MKFVAAIVLERSDGAAAGLLLVVGFLRGFYGAKGAAFYLQNPVFWAKIVTLALIAGQHDGARGYSRQRRGRLKKLRVAILTRRVEIERALDAD